MALQLPCEKTLTRTGYAQGSITHRIPTGRLQVPVQGVPRTGMIQGFHRYQSAHLCTGNCTWTEDGTKPQLLGGLGEEGGGGSSLQQMVEEEFGELSFLLGEP